MKRKKKRGMIYIPYDYEAAFNSSLADSEEWFREQLLKNRYKCIYALKEITAGEQFEIEIYPEFRSIDEVPAAGRIKKDNSKAQKNLNNANAIKYVERLINHNFTDRDIWSTLTYDEGNEPASMKEAVRNMQNYIKRINRERKKRGLKNARYIYVTEFDPEAEIRWHHHIIIDGEMDMDTVEAKWGKGSRNETRRLNKDEHGLAGMANYVTKDKNRQLGEKRWNSSTNLKQFRTRKVHSKRPLPAEGRYKPIEKYVDTFVRDQDSIRRQLEIWYPDYIYTKESAQGYYNDVNAMFYIRARMRKPKQYDKRKGG